MQGSEQKFDMIWFVFVFNLFCWLRRGYIGTRGETTGPVLRLHIDLSERGWWLRTGSDSAASEKKLESGYFMNIKGLDVGVREGNGQGQCQGSWHEKL